MQNFGSLGKGLQMSRIWTGIKLGVGAAVMLAALDEWLHGSMWVAFGIVVAAGLMAGVISAIEDYDG